MKKNDEKEMLEEQIQKLKCQVRRFSVIADVYGEHMLEYNRKTDVFVVFGLNENPHEDRIIENFWEKITNTDLIHEKDRKKFVEAFEKAFEKPVSENMDFRTTLFNDEVYSWYRIRYVSVSDEDGTVDKIIGRIIAINDYKLHEFSMKKRVEMDALTGLFNKATIEQKIKSYLDDEKACESKALHALLVIDIDNFKNVNDQLGHANGDLALKEIGKHIMSTFREGDLTGRIGGDEFIAFMKNIREVNNILKVAGRLCDALRIHYQAEQGCVDLSASIGIAVFPINGKDYVSLFKCADDAVYAAKSAGKDRFVIYNEKALYKKYQSDRNHQITKKKLSFNRNQEDIKSLICGQLVSGNEYFESFHNIFQILSTNYKMQHTGVWITSDCIEETGCLEWSAQGYELPEEQQKEIYIFETTNLIKEIRGKGMVLYHNIGEMPPEIAAVLREKGVKSKIYYEYRDNGNRNMLFFMENFHYEGNVIIESQLEEIRQIFDVIAFFILHG